MTDVKDNIRKQLDMRSYATRIWLVIIISGISLGVFDLIFKIDFIEMYIPIGIVVSSIPVSIFEKRIDRYFQNKRRLE